jgi:cob(I)alamin adenosyltransferase
MPPYNPDDMKTKFYTGTGDKGKVIIGKQKLAKNAPLFEMLGQMDEVNAWIGLARVRLQRRVGRKRRTPKRRRAPLSLGTFLENIQELMFVAQADVAARGLEYPRKIVIGLEHVKYLEEVIGYVDNILPPITSFVIPGGTERAAILDLARTRARTLERFAVGALGKRPETADMLQFLNRLSSVLFALARYENYRAGVHEQKPSYKIEK